MLTVASTNVHGGHSSRRTKIKSVYSLNKHLLNSERKHEKTCMYNAREIQKFSVMLEPYMHLGVMDKPPSILKEDNMLLIVKTYSYYSLGLYIECLMRV